MPATVRDTGGTGNFKPIRAGIHAGICDMVAMLGLQQDNFGIKEKVYLHFQVPKERVEYDKDGEHFNKPMGIGMTVTASLSSKATLYHLLTSWRGKPFTKQELDGFDLFNVLGKPCMLTVSHNTVGDKTYANIDNITRFQKEVEIAGQKVQIEEPQLEGEAFRYSADETGQFDKLPEWLRTKISQAVKPEDMEPPVPSAEAATDFNDDIPF